jgi:hypothetical protein
MPEDLVMVEAVVALLDDEQRALLKSAIKTLKKRGVIDRPEVQRVMYDRFTVKWEDAKVELPHQLLPLLGALTELLAADAWPVVATTKKGLASLRAASKPARATRQRASR